MIYFDNAANKKVDEFTTEIWENLNEANKISIYTRFVDLETGEVTNRMINKNK